MLSLNEHIDIQLDSMANGGDAVARHRGQTVFVPYGVPGDLVRAKVITARKTYARGSIQKILEPSPQRVKAPCTYFGECGSCQWQMMAYGDQLENKKKILGDVLSKLAGAEMPVINVIPSEDSLNYRNKAQYPVARQQDGMAIGYYRQGSHDIVPVKQCLILRNNINEVYTHVCRVLKGAGLTAYDEDTGAGQLRHLVLRSNNAGETALVLVLARPGISEKLMHSLREHPDVKSVWANINRNHGNTILGREWDLLNGEKYLVEMLGGIDYHLSAGSFWQVNQKTAWSAYQQISEALNLTGNEEAVDLYCGIGAISLQLARKCRKVVGIEVLDTAIRDARYNASSNGIDNVFFMVGKSEQMLEKIQQADVLVADPPRRGLEPGVVGHIDRLKPSRMAYLSCDPATLARDIGRMTPLGYKVRHLWLVDMFPQTYHIETLALLERTK
jgi:23S rRNA (uracil1939-C5)-methyltransferase